eukprot:CAMPEP_0182912136 /NCGR_PEP_ID=MMETSP0034_2-20130328/37354_1 /TAXON_ID=156128 /ORGANISM="Nephroselmis pyriformis, Strain CCMP717" /LENGTH=235 /DNA_ID=CAMNT_0025048789 /DNA_START=116 /DNA_END=823 /DNA_ORIENTATION=+
MKVVIRTLQDIHILHAELDETVLGIKEWLQDAEEVPVERQILHYAGKVLDDEDTLGDYSLLDYNMQAEVTLTMEVKQVHPMHIYVRTRMGKMVTLLVEATASIRSVMDQMEDAAWRKAGLDGCKLFNSSPEVVMKLNLGNTVPAELDVSASMSHIRRVIAEADGPVGNSIVLSAATDGNIHVNVGPSVKPNPGPYSFIYPRPEPSYSYVPKPLDNGEQWVDFKTELCTQSGPFPY